MARLVGVNHVALEVGDLDQALRFYGEIFELGPIEREPGMAFIEMGDQFLALSPRTRRTARPPPPLRPRRRRQAPRARGARASRCRAYADGQSLTGIVKALNEEGVPGRFKTAKGWSPATISRILDNEKYVGRWVWNRAESRRDPRTGKRRRVTKPESEWHVHEDEALRILPPELWEAVRKRRKEVRRRWPGGKGKRGFSSVQGSRQQDFPAHLLSGTMKCGSCGAAIAQVSGKAGGYYGCLGASRGACDNKVLVRRKVAERVIVGAVRNRIGDPEQISYLLERVAEEVERLHSDLPETLRLKEAELSAEERRLANFVEFIGEGRGSKALGQAIGETERKVEALREEVSALRSSREKVFRPPPVEWIEERVSQLQDVLERRTSRSALVLRDLLGPIRLEPVAVDVGRPYYRAETAIDALALIEPPPGQEGAEGGSNSLRKWRRRDSNPRPRSRDARRLQA